MIRFRLKTLLVFVILVAFLTLGWAYRPNFVWLADGYLALSFGPQGEYPSVIMTEGKVHQSTYQFIPLWIITLLILIALAVAILASIGLIWRRK